MPLQKATMASLLPSSTAVIMEGGLGKQGSGPGMTLNPSRLITSAARRPPLIASPVVCGPWNRPAGTERPHQQSGIMQALQRSAALMLQV
jgi:hypothetical protein